MVGDFINPMNWNPETVAAVAAGVSTFAALVSVWVAYVPIHKQKKIEKVLKDRFGADSYAPEIIENSTRYYVTPDSASVDPSFEAEIRNVVATKQNLFEMIDEFLEMENDRRYMNQSQNSALSYDSDGGISFK
jgi:hypothetical protein